MLCWFPFFVTYCNPQFPHISEFQNWQFVVKAQFVSPSLLNTWLSWLWSMRWSRVIISSHKPPTHKLHGRYACLATGLCRWQILLVIHSAHPCQLAFWISWLRPVCLHLVLTNDSAIASWELTCSLCIWWWIQLPFGAPFLKHSFCLTTSMVWPFLIRLLAYAAFWHFGPSRVRAPAQRVAIQLGIISLSSLWAFCIKSQKGLS